ncbi:MAG: hypothetical protein RL518_288 [Pseudomonadota bacterium]|jgi:hypothetical protein
MHEEWNSADALFELRQRYVERFGSLHPIIADLDPELLFVVMEMALEDDVEIDAASIEEALQEVDDRVALFKELSR